MSEVTNHPHNQTADFDYDALYEDYKKLYPSTAGIMHNLAARA